MPLFPRSLKSAWLVASTFIVPLLYLVYALWICAHKEPHWASNLQDPDYLYLTSSLDIATLHSPRHIDNPGTPLQILGGVVFRVLHLARSVVHSVPPDIIDDTFLNSELYLNGLSRCIVFCNAICLALLGFALSRQKANSLSTLKIAAIQFSFLIFNPTICWTARIAPEALVISMSALLFGSLFLYPQKRHSEKISGFLFGISVSLKLVYAPLICLSLLYKSIKQGLQFALWSILGFLTATIPIWPHYPQLWRWSTSLAAGTNEREGPVTHFFPALLEIMNFHPALRFFFLTPLAAILIYLFQNRDVQGDCSIAPRDQSTLPATPLRYFTVASVILILQLVLLVRRPSEHYFIEPLTVLIPGITLYLCNCRIAKIAMLPLLLYLSILTFKTHEFLKSQISMAVSRQSEFSATLAYPSDTLCRLVGYYTSSLKPYALALSNSYAQRRYSEVLQKLYPDQLQFAESGIPDFSHFGKEIPLSSIASRIDRGECFLFVGHRQRVLRGPQFQNRFLLKELPGSNESTGVFRILKIRLSP